MGHYSDLFEVASKDFVIERKESLTRNLRYFQKIAVELEKRMNAEEDITIKNLYFQGHLDNCEIVRTLEGKIKLCVDFLERGVEVDKGQLY